MEGSHGGGGRQSAAVSGGADKPGGCSPAEGKRPFGGVSPAAARRERRCGGTKRYVTEPESSTSGSEQLEGCWGYFHYHVLWWFMVRQSEQDRCQSVGMVTELLIHMIKEMIPCGGRGFNAVRVTCLIGEDY